jgi:hypothetical protein
MSRLSVYKWITEVDYLGSVKLGMLTLAFETGESMDRRDFLTAGTLGTQDESIGFTRGLVCSNRDQRVTFQVSAAPPEQA